MLKVDIILPSLISYQKYPNYRKFQIFQLQKLAFPNWNGNWFPVWFNLKNLKKKYNVKIRFLNYLTFNQKKLSKIVGFDARILNNLITKHKYVGVTLKKEILPLLKKIRDEVDFLIYFDNADNPGYFHKEVFQYVDRYYKKQMFKDHSNYSKNLYRERLFADFYARNYTVDLSDEKTVNLKISPTDLQKTGISWNFALKDYRYSNFLTRLLYGLTRKNKIRFYEPRGTRKYFISANYSIKHISELIYFQRAELLKLLEEKYKSNSNVSLGKIPKKIYLSTMRSSKAIVSPFGWGEICYRDFETFIAGAALIKPNMDHLETWPNLYEKNKTYLPISWKIEEWDQEFEKIFSDEKLLLEIARNGQNAYKKIWTKQGSETFCERFIQMITPNLAFEKIDEN